MATDDDVMKLLGLQFPLFSGQPCRYCTDGEFVVVGVWHPEGGASAYVVLGCLRCGATENGGAP